MRKPARRNNSMVAFSRLPFGRPSFNFMSTPLVRDADAAAIACGPGSESIAPRRRGALRQCQYRFGGSQANDVTTASAFWLPHDGQTVFFLRSSQ
jgi:hypothetical protein